MAYSRQALGERRSEKCFEFLQVTILEVIIGSEGYGGVRSVVSLAGITNIGQQYHR